LYNWFDMNNNLLSTQSGSFCFDAPGDYILILIDPENGCENSEIFTIEGPIIPVIDMPQIINLVNSETADISPQFNLPLSQITSFSWVTTAGELSCLDCPQPTITSSVDSMVVSLIITTNEGCTAESSLVVAVTIIPQIYIPNIFNPDIGDNFTIFSSTDATTISELSIYDRWGNTIFLKENFPANMSSEGWNGRRGDNDVEQGVYVYVMKYNSGDREEVVSGTITMIRDRNR